MARRSSAFWLQPPDLSRLLAAHTWPLPGVNPGLADPLPKVSAVEIPSFAATERIAAYSVSYSPRCPAPSRTARSRSSLGYCFGERLPRWAAPHNQVLGRGGDSRSGRAQLASLETS